MSDSGWNAGRMGVAPLFIIDARCTSWGLTEPLGGVVEWLHHSAFFLLLHSGEIDASFLEAVERMVTRPKQLP
jgi:hypothetical protein